MKRILTLTFAFATLTFAQMVCQAQNWSHWRGPNYNGSTEAKDLPIQFTPTRGVKWNVELPGPSACTPIVHGDDVYVVATDPDRKALVAISVNRTNGKIRWKHDVGSGYRSGGEGDELRLDGRSNYASPSPVTDGKHVFFFFGNGDLAAFTRAGEKMWQRNLQKDYGDFCFQWTFGSSPTLFEGKLYMQILQRNTAVGSRGKNGAPSFLLALNPMNGKEIWKHDRPSNARMESLESYATPIPFTHNGRKELLIAGGDVVTGHDPATGKELWRWGTWNADHREMWWRLVPSPVTGDGSILVCAPKRAPVYAVKAGASGDVSKTGLAWQSEARSEVTSDVPTPLFYRGKFIVVSDLRKNVTALDPKTGKPVWTTPLPDACWGSPAGADGKIYVLSLNANVFVLDAATGKLLATNPMAEGENDVRSSISIAQNQIFVRTDTRLFCIGK